MKKHEFKVASQEAKTATKTTTNTTTTTGLGPRYVGETKNTESSESRENMFQSHLDFEAQILEQMRLFQEQKDQQK